ncbi:hypothetical protein SAMN05444004_101432 [Jannaschia faecimaris]|uniref:Glyoxalase-related protein domain-containing protein n=1 Tax=Jannaschia faecimaris TaxID=1244108 RepID=A0A1H3JVC1_9RHOB|nr:glyoxalase superfamily protein [Jannaschia faecimaris]SDY43288.1 hypothetical protein SAMN05444004_101432 [Jannaschia faecimaris]
MTRGEAKARARAMRDIAAKMGERLSQGAALDRVARDAGHRDWNAMSATLTDGWTVPDRVTGRYLGQPFTAKVLEARTVRPGWTRLCLVLDKPVDAVQFESFSSLRHRVTGTVGPKGTSAEKTSDGTPHLLIDL